MNRLRKKSWADDYILKSSYLLKNKEEYQKFLNKEDKIWIEIGHGKGQFTLNLALKNPDVKIIGIEKIPSVQVTLIKKLEDLNLSNLKLISSDIRQIDNWFLEKSLDKIFINFPDPWPKKKHEKRRLLAKDLLLFYYKILKPGGNIYFKTDNKNLFYYTHETLKEKELENKFAIIKNETNLHQNFDEKLIKTEYEEKFINLGKSIYYLKLQKNYN